MWITLEKNFSVFVTFRYLKISPMANQCSFFGLLTYLLTRLTTWTMFGLVHNIAYIKLPLDTRYVFLILIKLRSIKLLETNKCCQRYAHEFSTFYLKTSHYLLDVLSLTQKELPLEVIPLDLYPRNLLNCTYIPSQISMDIDFP